MARAGRFRLRSDKGYGSLVLMYHISELKGQPVAKTMLERLSMPPHLLIFHGPEGTGKWSTAISYIKTFLCEVGTGCGTCSGCRMFQKNEHPDYIVFPSTRVQIGKPENPDAFTIRWLQQTRLQYAPFRSSIRFVLFPRADLILPEAETALLKTLEEPPDHTRFIFLVSDLSLLKDTIISRGMPIPFGRLPESVMKTLTGESDHEKMDLAGGSLVWMEILQSDLYNDLRNRILEAVDHPIALFELESYLLTAEKKGFVGAPEHLTYNEILDFFSLFLLRCCERNPQIRKISAQIFQFKGDLNLDMPGLQPYLISRLFHGLQQTLFHQN